MLQIIVANAFAIFLAYLALHDIWKAIFTTRYFLLLLVAFSGLALYTLHSKDDIETASQLFLQSKQKPDKVQMVISMGLDTLLSALLAIAITKLTNQPLLGLVYFVLDRILTYYELKVKHDEPHKWLHIGITVAIINLAYLSFVGYLVLSR